MHLLQREFPQGSVTGSWRRYEHRGHWISLTIFRASFEASSGPVGDEDSAREAFESLEKVDRKGREVLSGREDINGASSSVWPLDRPSGILSLAQSRSILSKRAKMRPSQLLAHRTLENVGLVGSFIFPPKSILSRSFLICRRLS